MSRMTKMKPKIQRTNGSAVSMNPASALDNIIDKFAGKGLGGQDMLPDSRRKIKPVMVTSSHSKSTISAYVREKTMFRTPILSKVEGMPVIPKPERKQEFVPIDSSCDATEDSKRNAPPFQRIIDRIVREGKPKDIVKQAQELFARK